MLPGDGPIDTPLQPCDHCGNTLRCKECAEWDGFCVEAGFTMTSCVDVELECMECDRTRTRRFIQQQYPPVSLFRALLGFDL